jgi:hypothetical protein
MTQASRDASRRNRLDVEKGNVAEDLKEGKMAQARLVKRSALIEQEKAERQQKQTHTGALRQSVRSVKEWISEHQTRRQPDAREAFAMLFAQP